MFDPCSSLSRKCSIQGFEQLFDPPVRASRKGVSAKPAAAQVFDPQRSERAGGVRSVGPALRRCSIRVAWSRLQVFDPHGPRTRKCSIRSFGKCSIRDMEPAGGCRIRASGDCEGSRSGGIRWLDLFDPRRPAAAQVFDPRYGAGRICSIGAVSIEHPSGRGVRSGVGDRATVRSTRPARRATVRSARHGSDRICSIRAPGGRASVRSRGRPSVSVFDPRVSNDSECSAGESTGGALYAAVDRVW